MAARLESSKCGHGKASVEADVAIPCKCDAFARLDKPGVLVGRRSRGEISVRTRAARPYLQRTTVPQNLFLFSAPVRESPVTHLVGKTGHHCVSVMRLKNVNVLMSQARPADCLLGRGGGGGWGEWRCVLLREAIVKETKGGQERRQRQRKVEKEDRRVNQSQPQRCTIYTPVSRSSPRRADATRPLVLR
jgi:hypothetical protein